MLKGVEGIRMNGGYIPFQPLKPGIEGKEVVLVSKVGTLAKNVVVGKCAAHLLETAKSGWVERRGRGGWRMARRRMRGGVGLRRQALKEFEEVRH